MSSLIWLAIGNISVKKNKPNLQIHPISVIVAVRNGEKSLPNLIADLSSQTYKGAMEFIIVDDESGDLSSQLIKNISKKDNRFIYEVSANGDSSLKFKKRALDAGIMKAKNEWLLFTDVDCRVPPTWVEAMAIYFNDANDYVIGFSNIESGNNLLNIFQSIDYFLLLVAARGAANLNHAWACSGQNQAYRKSLFNKVDGFSRLKKNIQGDDSLYMNICRKLGGATVTFAENPKSHVVARKEKTWNSFIRQRIRWSGDANLMWKVNFGFYLVMLIFFLLHILLFTVFIISIFNLFYTPLLVKVIALKFVMELILYFIGSRNFNQPFNIIKFSLWFIIHIPYIVLMGFGSYFSDYISWRGRKVHPYLS